MPPFISVVMPVRNEAAFIERSIAAVLAQDYPQDRLEVIVADGMSTDGTREVLATLQGRYPQLKVVDNPGRIVSTGLNRVLALAGGDIIVRIDGHCEIASDYVSRCVDHLRSGVVNAVGGPIQTIGETHMARVIAVAMSSRFGVGGSVFRTTTSGSMFTDTIPFPAYTRRIIEQAGGYDEELVRNQDDEYNYRLREIGVKLLFASDIRSRYYSRSSLRSLWRQYFQYGYWKVRVMQKHPRQMQARQFVPAAFVASVFVCLAAIPFLEAGWWLLALVVMAYLTATLVATAAEVRKHGWRMLPLLPIIYGTLHLSYGTGFWTGIFRFWRRWGSRPEWSSAPSM
jgi:glycosyltransferase involved in cell wall biosynthesis